MSTVVIALPLCLGVALVLLQSSLCFPLERMNNPIRQHHLVLIEETLDLDAPMS